MQRILWILGLLILVSLPSHAGEAGPDYEAYVASPRSNPKWDPLVKEGFERLTQRDFTSSLEFLKKAINLGCESPIVFFKLGLAYEATGSYYPAVQHYELAKKQFQTTNQNHEYNGLTDESIGRALYLMGDKKKAIIILKSIAQKTNRAWILKLLGTEALEIGDHLNATSYFERLFKFEDQALSPPERLNIYTQLARIYRNKKESAGAIRYYNEAIKIDPQNVEANAYLIEQKRAEEQKKLGEDFKEGQDKNTEKVLEIFEQH